MSVAEQTQAPRLEGDVIVFDDAQAFCEIYRKTLARGAVAVRCASVLEPLKPFEIRLVVPRHETICAQVQVISSRDGLCMLQLIDASGEAGKALAALAERAEQTAQQDIATSAPEPAIQDANFAAQAADGAADLLPTPPPIPQDDDEPAIVAPAPPPAPPVAAPSSPAPPQPEPPVAAPAAPPPAVAPPPQLVGNSIQFASRQAISSGLDEINKTGGLMTQAKGALPAFGSVLIRCTIEGVGATPELGAEVVFTQGDQVALIFLKPALACQALSDLAVAPEPSAASAQQTAARAARPDRISIPRRPLCAPDSTPALLGLDLASPPDPQTTQRSNLLELIAALGRQRVNGTLRISVEQSLREVPIKSGAMLLGEGDREWLIETSLANSGEVELDPQLPERIASDKRPRDPRAVVVDMLRRHLRSHRVQDLEVGLGARLEQYPLPTPRVSPALYGVKLEAKEARFLDVVLDGSRTMAELPRVSGMLRPATIRLFYLLLVYRLIELREDAVYSKTEDPRAHFRQECERLLAGTAFELLGAHWSDHLSAIKERYERRKLRFAGGGDGAKLDRELSRKVLDAMERAYEQLSTLDGRRDARKVLGDLDLKGAAHILAKHAELASLREDPNGVKRSLEMAMELHPSQEFKDMLARLLRR